VAPCRAVTEVCTIELWCQSRTRRPPCRLQIQLRGGQRNAASRGRGVTVGLRVGTQHRDRSSQARPASYAVLERHLDRSAFPRESGQCPAGFKRLEEVSIAAS